MDEQGDDEGLFQRCNLCWQPLTQLYRTVCNHCFCVDCATGHFMKDPSCPCCGMSLSPKYFRGPFDVGISTGLVIDEAIFKSIFQSNRLDEIVQAMLQCIPGVEEVVSFVVTQLFLQMQVSDANYHKTKLKLKKSKNDLKMAVQEARSEISLLTLQLKESEAWRRKKSEELETVKLELSEAIRKLKTYENVLVRLRSEGQNIHVPVSTPPPQQGHHYQNREPKSHSALPMMHHLGSSSSSLQPPMSPRGPSSATFVGGSISLPTTPQPYHRRGGGLSVGYQESMASKFSPHRSFSSSSSSTAAYRPASASSSFPHYQQIRPESAGANARFFPIGASSSPAAAVSPFGRRFG